MDSSFFYNLKQSGIAQALFLERIFPLQAIKLFRKLSYWIFWIVLGLYLYGTFHSQFQEPVLSQLLAGSFLLLSLFLKLFTLELFSLYLRGKTRIANSDNFADFLDFDSAKTLQSAQGLAKKKNMQEPNSSMILHELVKAPGSLDFVFIRLLLDKKGIAKELKSTIQQEAPLSNLADILSLALQYSKKRGASRISQGDLLCALAEKDPYFANLLARSQLSAKDVYGASSWLESMIEEIKTSKQFWLMENLRKKGTLARHWTAGFTALLDQFAIDLTQRARVAGFPRIVGHTREVQAVEQGLARNRKNNVLLVEEPGSGASSIIYELASKCLLGESLPQLNYRRILQLDLSSLHAQFQEQEKQSMLPQLFSEVVSAGNIILVIDNFHYFVKADGQAKQGSGDLTSMILPFLQSSHFPIIALTTYSGLHRTIEQNQSLLSLFEKVEVAEISEDEALKVLLQKVFSQEQAYKKFVPWQSLRAIIQLSQKYIQATPMPRKAVDLLDECLSYLSQTKDKVLLPSHIAKVIERKTQIPVGEVQTKEKDVLLNLETLIHERIVDQEEAVKDISSSLRRARAELRPRSGPMGGFLFLGPTGVGKTETAKALAAVYFGSETNMIRLDMSEFQNLKDIDRLLGSAEQDGLLTTPIRENPFSLILIDEIEKAHPNILNLFLQVLDEGNITDGLGRKVNFQHTIVIATSNAGYELVLQAIQERKDFAQLKEAMRDYLFKQGLFRPELLNRFDSVAIFKPLEREHLLLIAQLMLTKLKKGLQEKGIQFEITQELTEELAELGHDPVFGARPMKRAIQDTVENALAKALLQEDIKAGDTIQITKEFHIQHL
ncbi:MAG: ATP-dependent Clp protease ATP-binding subunit [Candidatus Wildermuthbacteria bacterium]|nr:ATP-dependent Clp protease ATP-binding subunit [Candidatus Wildermuthbacteria bacterium]